MSREDLAKRAKWQSEAVERGDKPEAVFGMIFQMLFKGQEDVYSIQDRPRDLAKMYGDRGIVPDHAIRNNKTGRSVFVEMKRQRDGGNAHERVCKYLLPSLAAAGKKAGNLRGKDYPFWIIFAEDLATHKRYQGEIDMWFKGYGEIYTRWTNLRKPDEVVDYYEAHIKPRIDRV